MSQHWEYRIEKLGSDATKATNRLNELGQESWELVTVLPDVMAFVLKRPCPYYGEPCDPDAAVS